MPIVIDEERFRECQAYGAHVANVLVALDEFYRPADAVAWLSEPQALLGGKKPTDLLLDEPQEVFAVIARLRDGAFV